MKRETQAATLTAIGGITQVVARLTRAVDAAAVGNVEAAAVVVAAAARSLRSIAEQLDGIASAMARDDDESDDAADGAPSTN